MAMSKKAMMELIAAGKLDESFTHIEDGTGKETTYNVTKMRTKAIKEERKVHTMTLPPDFAGMIRRLRDVDDTRVQEDLDVNDPSIILVFRNGQGHITSYLMLDGVHRTLRRIVVKNLTTMRAWIFEEKEAILVDSPTQVVLKDVWGTKGFLDSKVEQAKK